MPNNVNFISSIFYGGGNLKFLFKFLSDYINPSAIKVEQLDKIAPFVTENIKILSVEMGMGKFRRTPVSPSMLLRMSTAGRMMWTFSAYDTFRIWLDGQIKDAYIN